jgi:hypothetical protein
MTTEGIPGAADNNTVDPIGLHTLEESDVISIRLGEPAGRGCSDP